MSQETRLTILWVVLLALTLSGVWLGELSDPTLGLALFVIVSMAVKGRIIVDHFMELSSANRTIRNLMRAYFYVLPLLVLFTYLFGNQLARLTTI
ncbi:MAG: cytochrome C oxidase subunit IV family protein [Sedimenticola sp.]